MSNTYSVRLMNASDVLVGDEKGNHKFNKTFSKGEILANKHWILEDIGVVLQLNTEYKYIGCHDNGFDRVKLRPFKKEDMLTIIKNVHDNGLLFELDIDDDDDEDAEYYYEHDLRVLSLQGGNIEDYLERVSTNYNDIQGILRGVTIRDKEYTYRASCYVSGNFYIETYKRGGKALTGLECLEKVLSWVGYDDLENEPKRIKMTEHEIVKHPYSQLHILMAYLDEVRDTLPEEVVNALELGEDGLLHLAETYKDSNTYKR